MSTLLPSRVAGAGAGRSPSKSGKGDPGADVLLRDFRKGTPFDSVNVISACVTPSASRPVGSIDTASVTSVSSRLSDDRPPSQQQSRLSDDRPPSNSRKAGRASSPDRRVDRRFWPKDTRGLLEICEQGHALQQGMQSEYKDAAGALRTVADMSEFAVKETFVKLEEALQIIQRHTEMPANVNWSPIVDELHDKVKPGIVRDVLASQEAAAASLQSHIAGQLSQMAGQIVESMDVRQEAQKVELAALHEDVCKVQKGATEFEQATSRSQEEILVMFREQQIFLQKHVKEVVGQELQKVVNGVNENTKYLEQLEPLLDAQMNLQLSEVRKADKQHHHEIHQIHTTLHVDMGHLFHELGRIQKSMNLPFLLPSQKDNIQERPGGSSVREISAQTETTGIEVGNQTDLGITQPGDETVGKKKSKNKKGGGGAGGRRNSISATTGTAVMAFRRSETKTTMMDDAEKKRTMRQRLMRGQYSVADYYKDKGCFQAIARHPLFENITFLVILLNAGWIAFDTDHNDAIILNDADLIFQIAENAFCTYFSCEVLIRFGAFTYKRDCIFDFWFVFDSVLVVGMIAETWLLTGYIALVGGGGGGGGLGNLSILRMARMVKLCRMARMARLLRMVPELMMIIKGIGAALRSVWFFVLLTVIILYVFAVVFRQLTRDTETGELYFRTVPRAMGTLLLQGMLPLFAPIIENVSRANPALWPLIMIFILLASVTILNMLIGVLSEVVRQVAFTEKEAMTVTHVTAQLKHILGEFVPCKEPDEEAVEGGMESVATGDLGEDNEPTSSIPLLSKRDFEEFVMKEKVAEIIQEVGVDPIGIYDMADVIFAENDRIHLGISFEDFINVVLNLRGSNAATVKDVKETQTILKKTMFETRVKNEKFMHLELSNMRQEFSRQLAALNALMTKDSDNDSDEGDGSPVRKDSWTSGWRSPSKTKSEGQASQRSSEGNRRCSFDSAENSDVESVG